MSDKITTLKLIDNTDVFPNIKDENIPDTIMRIADLSKYLNQLKSINITGISHFEGEATFGHNVHVDGNFVVNGIDNIVEKNGNKIINTGTFDPTSDNLASQKSIAGAMEKKQDKLTAGDGITISDNNTISVSTSDDFSNRFAGGDIICNYYWINWQDVHYFENVTDLSYCFFGATLYSEPYLKPENSTVKFHDMPKALRYMGMFSHVKKTHEVELGTMGYEGNNANSGLMFYNSEFAKISVRDGCTVWCSDYWDLVFCNCPNLVSVAGPGCFDLSAVTEIPSLISNSPKVKDLSGLKHFRVSFDISPSTSFEESDLVTIISNLDPVTTTKTLTMGSANLAKLTQDQILVATGKGWTLA